LLEHIDSFLNDENCFGQASSSDKEEYVQWLFIASTDEYTNQFDHLSKKNILSKYKRDSGTQQKESPKDVPRNPSEVPKEFMRDTDGEMSLEERESFIQTIYGNTFALVSAPFTLLSSAYQVVTEYWKSSTAVEMFPKLIEEPMSVVGSQTLAKDIREFEVMRTNWYWKQQKRILRITREYLYRIDPSTAQKKAAHQLKDITKISVDKNRITFHFQDGAPPECYESESVDKIVSALPFEVDSRIPIKA